MRTTGTGYKDRTPRSFGGIRLVRKAAARAGLHRGVLSVEATVASSRPGGLDEVTGARRRLAQRGATAVEFALVAPIMILLALGIIDFGLYINAGSVVGNAAREGARAASLGASSATVNSVVTAAISALPAGGTTTISVTCRKPAGGNCSGYAADAISGGTAIVGITRVHHWLTPMGFGTTVDIIGKSEMRIE